jgi:hypothetical protein
LALNLRLMRRIEPRGGVHVKRIGMRTTSIPDGTGREITRQTTNN